jgi:hypothetical protein
MHKRKFDLMGLAGFALLSGSILSAAPALAHGGGKAEHGGQVQIVGETTFELVTKADSVELYVEDAGEDLAGDSMSAKLIVTGEKGFEVVLTAGSGDKVEAKNVTIPHGSKVTAVVTIKSSLAKVRANFKIK